MKANPERTLCLARLFVYGFLTLLITCVALNIESWPLTSFRLFSQIRGPEQLSWEITTVDNKGNELPVDWSSMPEEFKGWHATTSRLVLMDEQERESILRTWAQSVRQPDVIRINVYRLVFKIPTEPKTQRFEISRKLIYELEVAAK